MTMVRSVVHLGGPTSLGKFSPPPTIDHPPPVSIDCSNVTRISRVAGGTSAWPLSGVARVTFGAAARRMVQARERTTATAAMSVRSCIARSYVRPRVMPDGHPPRPLSSSPFQRTKPSMASYSARPSWS